MQHTSDRDTSLRVAYLGPQASFSHQAALEAFPRHEPTNFLPLPSFEALLSTVQESASQDDSEQDTVDYALLPVENSTNGGVVPVLDLLVKCGPNFNESTYPDIEIVAEHYLQVHHCLFVHKSVAAPKQFIDNPDVTDENEAERSTDDRGLLDTMNIKTLYSHPQVWGQCGLFLSANLPLSEVERINMSSTSAAAAFVAENPQSDNSRETSTITTTTRDTSKSTTQTSKQGNKAAICSSLAGKQNDLVCVASNIEDEPGKNTTRFFIIRNRNRKQHRLAQHIQIVSSEASKNQKTNTASQSKDQQTAPSSSIPSRAETGTLTSTAIRSSSSSSSITTISYKSLITFTIPHTTPGSLASALSIFSKHGFNLTSIVTRPSREQLWHYVFFVECEKERLRHQEKHQHQQQRESEGESERETIVHDGTERDGWRELKQHDGNEDGDNVDDDDEKVRIMFDELSRVTERSALLGSWVNRLRHPVV